MLKSFLTILLLVSFAFSQTVTVDVNTNRQTVRSWAAGVETGCNDYPVSCQDWLDTLLDDAVAAGMNGIHLTLQVAEVEDDTDFFQAWIDTGVDFPHANRTAWINNNGNPTNDDADPDTITAAGFVWGRLTHDMDNIVVPMRNKLIARGENLYLTFVMGHTSLSNQYFVDDPDEYGEWIVAVWNRFQSQYGFVPSALEIMGEPDHTDRQVTPAELVAMLVSARTKLLAAGHAEPLFYAPGTVSAPAAEQFYLDMKTANATGAGYIDALTYHRYQDIDDADLTDLFNTANTDGKLGTGHTEFDWGGATADLTRFWSDMAIGRNVVNSGLAIGYPGSSGGSAYFFISGTLGSGPYTVNKTNRAKYFEHFWKYVRSGAVGKGVTNSHATCNGLPFRNPNGTYVVVLRATGSVTCTVEDLPPGTYGRRRTQGDGEAAPSSYDTDLGDATVTTTEDVTFTFTAAGIGTIYDVNYLQSSSTIKMKLKGVKLKGVKL